MMQQPISPALCFKYVYQPIVDAKTGRTFGFEALCRPTYGAFSTPEELVACAEEAGRLNELGLVMREVSTEALNVLPEDQSLFLNVHPAELDDLLLMWAMAARRTAHRIVLEITETVEITDYDNARAVVAGLRRLGFRIALDDVGSGYAGLKALAALEPDFVKLDMEMIRDIQRDSRLARLIKHLVAFADEEGIQVIAEGVETLEERAVVTELGTHLLQGYLVARPAPLTH